MKFYNRIEELAALPCILEQSKKKRQTFTASINQYITVKKEGSILHLIFTFPSPKGEKIYLHAALQ